MTNRVIIYTDGACRGNPGPGGWGVFLIYASRQKTLNGYEPETTNNRMELTAAIEGLKALTRCCDVDLKTDSRYVLQGINEWIDNWKSNGWKTASRKPVKNTDLWQLLDEQAQRHRINWRWVKGHAGIEGNEKADQLANEAIDLVMEKS
jgi:ribonuclease HI